MNGKLKLTYSYRGGRSNDLNIAGSNLNLVLTICEYNTHGQCFNTDYEWYILPRSINGHLVRSYKCRLCGIATVCLGLKT